MLVKFLNSLSLSTFTTHSSWQHDREHWSKRVLICWDDTYSSSSWRWGNFADWSSRTSAGSPWRPWRRRWWGCGTWTQFYSRKLRQKLLDRLPWYFEKTLSWNPERESWFFHSTPVRWRFIVLNEISQELLDGLFHLCVFYFGLLTVYVLAPVIVKLF